MSEQITDDSYEPDTELANALVEVFENAEINYHSSSRNEVSMLGSITQQSYTATLGNIELEGYQTISPLYLMVSLEGNLGFASALMLAKATQYGMITQAYTDELTLSTTDIESYHDLTAEWYSKSAIEMGLPEIRLENRIVEYETEMIDINTLEDWAQLWLSKGKSD